MKRFTKSSFFRYIQINILFRPGSDSNTLVIHFQVLLAANMEWGLGFVYKFERRLSVIEILSIRSQGGHMVYKVCYSWELGPV